MRHGRKSRSQRVDGYKRHVLKDLDIGVVRAVGITPANVPEATVTLEIAADLLPQNVNLLELHIDRAYLTSSLVKERSQDLSIVCKAWPVRNGKRFDKSAFTLDWEQGIMHCPNQASLPFQPGQVVHFPPDVCATCPLRSRCTTSKNGRSVSVHPDQPLLHELRQRQATAAGRAKLRSAGSGGAYPGPSWSMALLDRARYLGTRKNLFDLRRMAVVHNLHVIARIPEPALDEVA